MWGITLNSIVENKFALLYWQKKLTSAKTQSSRACFAFFVIEHLCSFARTAVTIRGNRGTENLNIAGLQPFFSENSKGFMFGRSTANQANRLRTMNPLSE